MMYRQRSVLILKTWIPLFVVLLIPAPPPCTANPAPKQLLVLHAYHKAEWTDSLLRGIESVLGDMNDLDISIEYMDTKRLRSDAYYRALDKVYGLKYSDTAFDVILTTDDNAYRYALERQQSIFKGAPIVFCGVNHFDPLEIENNPLVTGVVEKGDFHDNLAFAVRARPRATAVDVIVDHTATAQINLKAFQAVVHRAHPSLAVHQLTDLSVVDLGAALAALPASDFAFFISYWQDGLGNPVSPDHLSEAFYRSAVPIFGRSEWMVTKGLTGGKCVSGFHQGEAAARLARRILLGEPAANMPVILDSPNRFMFDYKLLKRYGIDTAMLPVDSIVFNEPGPSFFKTHHMLIVSVITIMVLLMALVAILSTSIAKRRRTESALRESEARYRQLVQYAPSGIYELDLVHRRFLSVNDVICNYTGYTRSEFLNLAPEALVVEEDIPKIQKVMAGLSPDAPIPPTLEFRIKNKEGHTIWVMVNARFTFKEGRPVTLTAVAHDISVQREAEAAKKELEAKLAQVQRLESMGTLAGGIAHDFNNLLMGVLGNVSLMQLDENRNGEDLERLRNMDAYIRRGVALTNQLLGLARGGKYEVRPANVNLIVGESATMFSRTKKEIRVHRQLQEGLWRIECDKNQVDQALMNIFVNAWQAMPNGGDLFIYTENIVLNQRFVQPHRVPPGRYVKISVTDTGIGMDGGTMARIFDPFFTTKERERGTGLGLASTYGIIKNHGGIIDVSSQPGYGTSFYMYLPATDKAAAEEAAEAPRVQKGTGQILLIDDEALVINVARKMLEKLGYQVLTAESGGKAIEIYKKNNGDIDLVVLDMIMPDMNGAETFKRLQQIDPAVCVLLSSGYSINGKATELLARGCRGFIQKPFRVQELSQKIRSILDDA